MRYFEKISYKQFKKDICEDKELYDNFSMPVRKTMSSAGYDFSLLSDLVLNPGEKVKIATGIKSFMGPDEVLFIVIRSSLGFKYNIRLCNQVGVIDADYFNNPENEGHIFIKIENVGEETLNLKKGDCFAQGIFMNYLKTRDDDSQNERTGGSGSTSRK